MRKPIRRDSVIVALAAMACCLAVPSAFGDVIGASYSGSGGTGATGLMGGNLIEPILTYTSLGNIDVAVEVDAAGSYLINEAPGFGNVFNTTGQTWVAFDLTNLTPALGSFDTDWFDGSSQLPTVASSANAINFSGGNVAPGVVNPFKPFGHFIATQAGTFILREVPSATIAVPEPSSVVLCALSALGLFFAARRRKA